MAVGKMPTNHHQTVFFSLENSSVWQKVPNTNEKDHNKTSSKAIMPSWNVSVNNRHVPFLLCTLYLSMRSFRALSSPFQVMCHITKHNMSLQLVSFTYSSLSSVLLRFSLSWALCVFHPLSCCIWHRLFGSVFPVNDVVLLNSDEEQENVCVLSKTDNMEFKTSINAMGRKSDTIHNIVDVWCFSCTHTHTHRNTRRQWQWQSSQTESMNDSDKRKLKN